MQTSLSVAQRGALARLPVRRLTDVFYRQTAPDRQPFDLPPRARRDARWHRTGDPWPAYAADSELAAMLEQPRHFVVQAEAPLPHRRISELHTTELPIIDVANPLALQALGLAEQALTYGEAASTSSELCREISDEVRRRSGAEGLLVPSAAALGARVLVIFPSGFDRIVIGDQRLVELAVVPHTRIRRPEPEG